MKMANDSGANSQFAHRLSHNVNRTGDYDQAPKAGPGAGQGEGGGNVCRAQHFGAGAGSGSVNLPGRGGAWIVGAGGNDAFGQREEDLGDLADGLVAHGAKEKREPALAVML